ncbi:glycosyltransferase involved in cell wall biosynthesis [Arcticibacter tournemirensis]|uniref:Glycosyltransferase family 1 protein n=1 Tax=Arcticibacter tournemirensis TaxID=699437 RepID=A0A5M9HD31_9SPHI|nr:glycosyltransferase [Arcticibacter tournemirensis]KAA8482797.1 glycosyltransferase family 1 protein [Arcticibacter tournemirensis]TQM51098.1 glycosyltransferase involved in cell wall biosynthesis [Arcticibacter tournemirensis]
MNFVFVSLQRIHTDRESTSTSLAKELSKQHKVLYVNPPVDRRTLLLNENDQYTLDHIAAIRNKTAGLSRTADNLWVLNPSRVIESINWIPGNLIFSLFNYLNNKRFAADIRKAIQEIGFEQFVLVNDKDMFRSFYLKELLSPEMYVYLDRDYTLGFDYWKKHGFAIEPALMRKSDAVVCNSLDFTKRAAKYNKNSFYIGNGADLEVFDPQKEWLQPEDLKDLKKPLIGYVGALNSMRIDISLIESLAEQKPEWTFAFVGAEDDNFRKSRLHALDNIIFIEKKHTSIVPAYVKYFDVCINPQLVNEITIGNFPLKIVEYLAMGRPVVATETNTMKEVFSDHTYLCKTSDEYISAITDAMEKDNDQLRNSRMAFAKTYSWEAVAKKLLWCIETARGKTT